MKGLRRAARSLLVALASAGAATTATAQTIFANGFEIPSCAGTPGPHYSATLAPAEQSAALGTVLRFTLIVRSCDYQGPVSLAATGVPATWTASFEPATLELALGETRNLAFVVNIPTNAIAGPGTPGVRLEAGLGDVQNLATQVTVANEVVVNIPLGTGSGNHQFPPSMTMRVGSTLRIYNADISPHRMHFDAFHQDQSMGNGQSYSIQPTEPGPHPFYCHDHGTGTGETQLLFQ